MFTFERDMQPYSPTAIKLSITAGLLGEYVVLIDACVEIWQLVIDNPSLTDAILDRLIQIVYEVMTKGEAMREL